VKWTFSRGTDRDLAAIANSVVYISSMADTSARSDRRPAGREWDFSRAGRLPHRRPWSTASSAVSSIGSLAALDVATGRRNGVRDRLRAQVRDAEPACHASPADVPDAWDVFTSSPAVANGKVYFGSGDGNVYAVDAKSGVLAWKFATGDVVHASPAVAGNTVYIGSWDGRLYAIDAESGQQKWAFEAGQDPTYHNQVGFQSSPAVVDGTVYVGCRDAHVYALDAATGRK
jgi:outer membrane protein assembly factor BamB